MKKGIEYSGSLEQRIFDLGVASALLIPSTAGRLIVGITYGKHLRTTVVNEVRIGRNRKPFVMQKIVTNDPETGEPFNHFAEACIAAGMDELGQASNIFRGDMSARGFRPLLPVDFEEYMDCMPYDLKLEYERYVLPTNPGIFSSVGHDAHMCSSMDNSCSDVTLNYAHRADGDIRDARNACLAYDAKVIKQFITSGIIRSFARNVRNA